MLRAILRILFLLLAGMNFNAAANAQLAIDRLWVDLDDDGATRSDLVIRNESEDVYYISVVASEMKNPGSADEQRVTTSDPEELGLLVTPNRLILRPGDLRAIRVVSLNRDLTQDRIYRILINPEIGEVTYEPNEEEIRGIALKLLAAFDVLVTVRPRGASPDLIAHRIDDRIEFANRGPTNLLMLDGKVCPIEGSSLSEATLAHYRSQLKEAAPPEEASGGAAEEAENEPQLTLTEDGCVRLPGRRLYPGNIWPVAADDDAELRFMVRSNANEDLRGLTVRCSVAPRGFENSDVCRIGGSDADAGAVASTPAKSNKELKL